MKVYGLDLLEHQQAAHIKSIHISLLKETFPHCLTLKEGPYGLPKDFHLKDALQHALKNSTSDVEQSSEFSNCMASLLNKDYTHNPNTKSSEQHLKSMERIKRRQDLVAPFVGTGINYITLINHTQNKLAAGVGGRKDLALELRNEWAPLQAKCINMHWTQDKIWDACKTFYQQKMKRLDQQGLITKKKTNANIAFIPNQAEINHDTTAALTGLQDQIAALCDQHREISSAMSVISQQQQSTVPAVIQTTQDNSPTFTQAQCDRQIRDLKIYFGKQLDALQGAKTSSHGAGATSVLSQGSAKWPSEQRNEQKDNQG